jgi:exonuclease III
MKWKEQKAKEVEDTGFKLWYTGNTSTKNGVGIVLDESLKDGVVDIKRQGDRIILVKSLVEDLVFNVISAYAPQIGLNESVKMQFWEELNALVSSVSISEVKDALKRMKGGKTMDLDGIPISVDSET